MTQPLPDLQKRAVDLLPQLVTLIQQSPTAPDDPDSHPAAQRIRQEFSSPGDRIMGALLRAYLQPLITGNIAADQFDPQPLQDIIAGNVKAVMKVDPGEAAKQVPLIMKGFYGVHKITEDMFMQHYGTEQGTRLAAALAPLSNPVMLPLGVTMQMRAYTPVPTQEVVNEFKRQIDLMKAEGTCPAAKTVLEIGASPGIADMPQTQFFDYKSISAIGRHASPGSSGYITLESQPNESFDYVMTNNVICPEAIISSTKTAIKENGNIFCLCANLVKPQTGKIIHTNAYDNKANSPPLYDTELHTWAGVKLEKPLLPEGSHVTASTKCWIYTKPEERQVTAEEYNNWLTRQKLSSWESEWRQAEQAKRLGGGRGELSL